MARLNERLSELKTCLLSCSYHLAIIEKVFLSAKLQGSAPRKEDVVILFASTHYTNFDPKIVSLLNKLKKVFNNCEAMHTLKQSKNSLSLFKILFLKSIVDIAMSVKIFAGIYARLLYKNLKIS